MKAFMRVAAGVCAAGMAAGSWALPVVTPPPVIVIPPAPLVPDPLARFVKASGWVPGPRGPVRAELILDGADAVIRVSSADAPRPRIYTISSPSEVLVLLADKHMEFLWKPLAEWAGPGLETFREQRLAKLRAAAALGNTPYNATTATESTVRPKYRAQLQLAAFLTAIGRSGESDQLLQSQLAEIKLKQNAGWSGIEWFSIAARIANNRWARGDNAGAIAEYAWMEQSMGDSPYAVNATVNRAAFLAMSGQYAAALPAIEAAYARYLKDNRGDRIAGSERQFAWIRACALDGLGRHSEAMEQFRVVMDDRQWRDPDFVIESNSNVRVRGWTCMKQTDALIAYLKDAAREDLFAGALMPLQPARKLNHDRELWAKVRADPELAKLVNERMRVLPAEYDAALNAWGTGEQ